MRKFIPLLLLTCCCFGSCYYITKNPAPTDVVQAEAYVPVYGDPVALKEIKSIAPQPIVDAGKIYVFGNYLFQVEKWKGIHVIEYSNRNAPMKLGFIRSPGAVELAVKDGFLVTNNMSDLVTINISNLTSAKEAARIPGAFENLYMFQDNYVRPPEKGKYFVCPDIRQGEVLSWKLEKNVPGAYCFNN